MVVQDNPFDCVDVKLPSFRRPKSEMDTSLEARKFKIAAKMDLLRRPLWRCITPQDNLDGATRHHLMIIAMDEAEISHCESAMDSGRLAQPTLDAIDSCLDGAKAETRHRANSLFLE